MALVFDLKDARYNADKHTLETLKLELEEAANEVLATRRTCSQATFEYARKCVNPYELVSHINTHESPSTKNRAYFTMLELAAVFPGLVDCMNDCTLHLCESPGSFIDAVLFLSNQRADWHGVSLCTKASVPFYEHHLAAKKPNGHSRVIFGDDSGDILRRETARCIIYEIGAAKAMLVTADGDTPEEDEASMVPLIAAQMFTALRALAPGGAFVLKVYNTFEPATQQLIGICRQLFYAVCMVKLGTTNIVTADRYVVCQNFNASPELLTEMLTLIEPLAFEGQASLHGVAPAPLSDSMMEIGQRQHKALIECVALAEYFHAIGIVNTSDARRHFISELAMNTKRVADAQDMLARLYRVRALKGKK
jgi:23S rRNA U2552 (ribose-2'-O)-methylase RlmE/FtsJ